VENELLLVQKNLLRECSDIWIWCYIFELKPLCAFIVWYFQALCFINFKDNLIFYSIINLWRVTSTGTTWYSNIFCDRRLLLLPFSVIDGSNRFLFLPTIHMEIMISHFWYSHQYLFWERIVFFYPNEHWKIFLSIPFLLTWIFNYYIFEKWHDCSHSAHNVEGHINWYNMILLHFFVIDGSYSYHFLW